MKIYRFSPIQTEVSLREAIGYVQSSVLKLATQTVGKTYPISYLTIFSHYQNEYEELVSLVSQWGDIADANNGVKVQLTKPIENIPQIRIKNLTLIGCK